MADNSTSLALAQLAALNQNFASGLAPFNNYAATNLQLAVAQQRQQQEEAQRIHEMQLANQFASQRDAAQFASQAHLAQMAESAAMQRLIAERSGQKDNSIELARLQHGFNREDLTQKQADEIRNNPQARRVIGNEIAKLPNTAQGNAALVAAYNTAFANPKTSENLSVEDAVSTTKQIKDVVGRLTTSVSGSPQSKQAILTFLATPGVTDLLIKKGELTAQDIQAIQQGGDTSKVIQAIQHTAETAITPWGERDYLSRLIPAWNNALVQSGAATTPDQMVNADYLRALLQRRDESLKGVSSEEAWQKVSQAAGFGPTPSAGTAKIPPPPALGLNVTQPSQTGSISPQPVNPFSRPQTPGSDKIGVAAGIEKFAQATSASTGQRAAIELRNNILRGLSNLPNVDYGTALRATAFSPNRFSEDPHTEYDLRRGLLDELRNKEAFKSGITQGAIPFVPNYTPKYDAFQQTKDEDAVTALVQGLFSPKK